MKQLTNDEINLNADKFINILKTNIKREGADIDGLIKYLKDSEFFLAPATTQYYSSFNGGLCLHSLNVYETLVKLTDTFVPGKFNKDTLCIVGLLHAISKADLYEEYVKNEKIYNPRGSKYDSMGNFDWISSKAFKVRDAKERMTLGGKAFNSYYIISGFLPLMEDEVVAILNQYAGSDKTENVEDVFPILSKVNLTVYLHTASLIASYCLEND